MLVNINRLNRGMEELIQVGNEFAPVESLWSHFESVMGNQGQNQPQTQNQEQQQGEGNDGKKAAAAARTESRASAATQGEGETLGEDDDGRAEEGDESMY